MIRKTMLWAAVLLACMACSDEKSTPVQAGAQTTGGTGLDGANTGGVDGGSAGQGNDGVDGSSTTTAATSGGGTGSGGTGGTTGSVAACTAASDCGDLVLTACETADCVNGVCVAVPKESCCLSEADCDTPDPCSVAVCIANQCEYSVKDECCLSAQQCDDNDPCTIDSCGDNICEHAQQVGCCTNNVQCNDDNACTQDTCVEGQCQYVGNNGSGNSQCVQLGYWAGVARDMALSPYGNTAAIACHNCYTTASSNVATNLTNTLSKLHQAQADGADLLELDIKDEGGVVTVDHDDDGDTNGALFSEVIADAKIKAGNQLLYIEIKETQPTAAFIAGILDSLNSEGYGVAGRPVILRAFTDRRKNLLLAQTALKQIKYSKMAPHVRLHELFGASAAGSETAFQKLINATATDAFHGVELNFKMANVMGRLAWARSLGLGVGIWTVPSQFGEAFVAAWRNEVDAIVVDYSIAGSRAVVMHDNGRLYLNARDQQCDDCSFAYHRTNSSMPHIEVNAVGLPDVMAFQPGEDLYGGVLNFDDNNTEYLNFGPVTMDPGEGVLVAAVVNFDDLGGLSVGEAREIVACSDYSGFFLDIKNEGGLSGQVLRFGVRVNDDYYIAKASTSLLDGDNSYVLIGAYDGDGGVRMWINGSDAGVTTDTATGPMTPSASPLLVGADPQGETDTRYHLDGKIQMVSVMSWGTHTCANDNDCSHLSDSCGQGTCDVKSGICHHILSSGYCRIAGECIPQGAAHPTNVCWACDSSKATHEWTPNAAKTDVCVPVDSLRVSIGTSDSSSAGTDNGMEICFGQQWCLPLDVPSYNDLETGKVDYYPYELKQDTGSQALLPLTSISLKPRAGTPGTDAWKPQCVAVVADDKMVYCNDQLGGIQIGLEVSDGDAVEWIESPATGTGCSSCTPWVVTHGPMVGHTTTTESTIWVRTASSVSVSVRYGTDPSLSNADESTKVKTSHASGFTGKVTLTGLAPDTVYYYQVWAAGKPASKQGMSFRTAPVGDSSFRVAMGSCMKYAYSNVMPIFGQVLDENPQILLMLGDNMYADSTVPSVLNSYYLQVRHVTSYASLLANTATWAIWDDHDYTGNNDDGKAPCKFRSLKAFERFWANPSFGSDGEPGIWFNFSWGDVEFFMLDDRYHRIEADKTMLGQTQLDWLLSGLASSKATFKVIASGSQWSLGGSSDSWAVFPLERELILDSVMENGVSGVILVTGDIHRTEVRRVRDADATNYAVYEFVSSPFAQKNSGGCSGAGEPDTVLYCQNSSRYFGLLDFETDATPPKVTYHVRNENNENLKSLTLTLDELSL